MTNEGEEHFSEHQGRLQQGNPVESDHEAISGLTTRERLERNSTHPHPEKLGLIALMQTQPPPDFLTESTRSLLEELGVGHMAEEHDAFVIKERMWHNDMWGTDYTLTQPK